MREPSARLQDMAAAAMNSSKTISGALASSGLDPSEARILLAHVLRCNRAWLAARGNETLPREAANAFDALVRRRHAGEPIAYLTGRRAFHDIELEVTPDVLIPRPETELLVDFALARIAS